jgi:hypothetical protein
MVADFGTISVMIPASDKTHYVDSAASLVIASAICGLEKASCAPPSALQKDPPTATLALGSAAPAFVPSDKNALQKSFAQPVYGVAAQSHR